MSWLAVAIAMAFSSGPPATTDPSLPWTNVGRFLTRDTIHAGARLHVFVDPETADGALEWGVAGTLQVSVRSPL